MNYDAALEAIFPPAAELYRVLSWWQQQPGGAEALQAGAMEFFGSPEFVPDQADVGQAPEVIRFLEWALLDRQADGQTPAERYAAQAPKQEAGRLANMLGNRHDAWRVEEAQGDRVVLRPLGGGESLVVTDARFAYDLRDGEWVVGRFYPWSGSWLPSIAVFFVPGVDEGPGSAEPMSALMAQRVFFTPEDALEMDPAKARGELAEFLEALRLDTSLERLQEEAARHETPQAFLEAFVHEAGREIFAGDKGGTRLGALLTNLWYHTPRAELEGKTPAEVDAEANAGIDRTLDRLFAALAADDEAAIAPLIDPDGELALVYDLWGMAGLHLLIDWGGPVGERRLIGQEPDMGATRIEVVWDGPAGSERGATLWLVERPEGFLVTEAVPELEDLASPDYVAAQEKGKLPAWRSPTEDPVEQKLRNAVTARKLPLLEQATMIKAWRMVCDYAERDTSQPEAWAAAVEAFFRSSLGQEMPIGQVADMYGAKKALVKERFQVLQNELNQSAS